MDGNSLTFSLAGEPFTASGELVEGQMAGLLQAATPFCQCTEPFLTGTWTATPLQAVAARVQHHRGGVAF